MKRAFAASILILACTVVRAQNPPALQLGERVDVIAKKALARPVAGISIAVARDGRIVFARGYGVLKLADVGSIAECSSTRVVGVNLARPFKAGSASQPCLRRVATGEFSIVGDATNTFAGLFFPR